MLLLALLLTLPQGFARGEDWCSTGHDCVWFAVGDVDGDGFADVVTLNGARQLCVAFSVRGIKAASWEVLRDAIPDGAVGLEVGDWLANEPGAEVVVRFADRALLYGRRDAGRFSLEQPHALAAQAAAADSPVDPPPYEPQAAVSAHLRGDVDGDGRADALAVFTATLPHAHRCVRVAMALRPGDDADGDGLADARERELLSDPADRDSDDDGLLDGFEVHGLPRGVALGDIALSPVRRDVIVAVSRYEQLDETAVRKELEKSKRLYAQIPLANPDGTTGISLHLRYGPAVPAARQGNWWDVGARELKSEEIGLLHWMQVTPGGGGQAQQTGNMGSSGNHFAAFAHELGHQLSLSHEGDSAAGWCPLYPSLMNYAFNYQRGGDPAAIGFSDGSLRAVELREPALTERLPFPIDKLRYLAAPPYRFRIEADGAQATWIDWDHDGSFAKQPVEADVNYGGSTHCGLRRNVDLSPAAPALGVVDGVVQLALVEPRGTAVHLRSCLGDGQWSAARAVDNSATRDDPLLVGAGDHGYLWFRAAQAWRVVRFSRETLGPAHEVSELRCRDLAVQPYQGKLLVVTRHDDDSLALRIYDPASRQLGPAAALPVRSRLAPGLALDPQSGHLWLACSRKKGDYDLSLWLDRFELTPGDPVHVESIATRGQVVNPCTTRPTLAFRGAELNVFHTGWQGANGLAVALRTRRVGNRALDDGWLTCVLYDEWTLTRAAVAFAEGQAGPVYAYRWDAGDHGDMKVNTVQSAHDGWGIEDAPMRDFDDGKKIALWGIRHSILYMRR